jgi:hypothetical protein
VKTLVTEPTWKMVRGPAPPDPPVPMSPSWMTAQASDGTKPSLTSRARPPGSGGGSLVAFWSRLA